MSMASLEREILAELKVVSGRTKLRLKDINEWSTGKLEPCAGEEVWYLPGIGVYATITKEG